MFFGNNPENTATINRLSSWEVAFLQNLVLSENILIGATPSDGIPSLSGNHQGGGMVFGENDYLFVSTGDSASANYVNEAIEFGIIDEAYRDLSGIYRSQVISQGNGKILRIQGWSGRGVASNPYYEGGNPYSFKSRLWGYGYRNPFRITYNPVNKKLIAADVGAGGHEEVTEIIKDANAGWGKYEGFDNYAGWSENQTNPDTGLDYDVDYQNPPLLDYGHNGNAETRLLNPNDFSSPFIDGNAIEGNSITGGIVLENFGEYTGFYMFTDYTKGWINLLSPDGSYTVNFAPEGTVNAAVDIKQDSNGDVYIVRLFGGIDVIKYDPNLGLTKFAKTIEKGEIFIIYNSLGQMLRTGVYNDVSDLYSNEIRYIKFPKLNYSSKMILKTK